MFTDPDETAASTMSRMIAGIVLLGVAMLVTIGDAIRDFQRWNESADATKTENQESADVAVPPDAVAVPPDAVAESAGANRSMQVAVPPDAVAGATIQVQAPTGETVEVQVPPGIPPGGVFAVQY